MPCVFERGLKRKKKSWIGLMSFTDCFLWVIEGEKIRNWQGAICSSLLNVDRPFSFASHAWEEKQKLYF